MKLTGSRKRQFAAWAFLLGISLFLATPFKALADEEYQFERMWPTLQQPWYFNLPFGIAVDSNGFIYVSDGEHCIQKFTSECKFVAKWGSVGGGDGEVCIQKSAFNKSVPAFLI